MATEAHIYRTIDGGATWYRLPEARGATIPAADSLNTLTTCGPNRVWTGGVKASGDGILIRGNGYSRN